MTGRVKETEQATLDIQRHYLNLSICQGANCITLIASSHLRPQLTVSAA